MSYHHMSLHKEKLMKFDNMGSMLDKELRVRTLV